MISTSTTGLSIKLNKVINSNCKLGEGLCIQNGNVGWVDIISNQIFLANDFSIDVFPTKNKPSVIYDIFENEIIFGSDVGLTLLNRLTEVEIILENSSHMHNAIDFRSNDGGRCAQHQLLGFMHRKEPETKPGFIYRVSGDTWSLLDDTIHIPNTFVEIDPSKILISDSLTGKIWLLELDSNGALLNKKIWAELEVGKEPDGGCRIADFVLIAIWDGAAIAVFTKDGELIEKLTLPVIRPTNCKYDAQKGQLWVTSASEGLSKDQLKEYPDSGNTFVFDLEFL